MKKFLLAWNFLTRLPLGPKTEMASQELGPAMAFFPLVGLAMAIFPCVFILFFYPFVSGFLGSVIVIFIFVLLSGGLHLDGLADTVDGLAGGKDRSEILSIMRDSRIGSMGVLALILLILFKVTLLNEIWVKESRRELLEAIILFPMLGRWSLVSAAWLSPYAREEEGIGEAFAGKVRLKEWLLSTAFTAALTFFIFKYYAILFLLVVFLTAMLLIKYSRRRLAGVTGDVLGAINELVEAFSLGYLLLFFKL
jgi:adenosylcobinamide-GDP ribazoletransferase